MAGSSLIRAGGAFIEIALKNNLGKELDKIQKQLNKWGDSLVSIGKKMVGIGVAMTAPLLLASKGFADMGDEVNKASQRTGVAVEAISALKYAADQSGTSLEDVEKALGKMSKTIFEAAAGSKEATEALASLGLTADDLKGMKPEDQFLMIGDALNQIGDQSAKTAVGMAVLGKSAASLFPLFADGADGVSQLMDRAKELGLVIGKQDAEAATKFGDTLDDLWKQVKMVGFEIGSAVANALQPFATAAIRVMRTVIDWTKEHKNLVIGLLAGGAAMLAAGAATIALGYAFKLTAAAISGVVSGVSTIGTVLTFLLNPIVLVGAGLVGLAGYLLYVSGYGGKAMAWLGERFNELADTATTAFAGVADALAAGDIGLAANILWTGLKLAWIQGTQTLREYWYAFKDVMVQAAADAFYGTLSLWENVKAKLKTSWENTTSFLGNLWDGFIGTFTDLWNGAVNLVTKGLNVIKGLWDDTFDSDAANKGADALLAKQKAARNALEMSNNSSREGERAKAVADIEKQRKQAVAELKARNAAVDSAADQNMNDDVAALSKQKTDLQKQLKDLRGQAKEERSKTQGAPALGAPKFDMDDVLQMRGAGTAKAAGLFNVAGLDSLAGGGAMDEVAANTRQIEKNTRKSAAFA